MAHKQRINLKIKNGKAVMYCHDLKGYFTNDEWAVLNFLVSAQ
jgi:hypothetical protein